MFIDVDRFRDLIIICNIYVVLYDRENSLFYLLTIFQINRFKKRGGSYGQTNRGINKICFRCKKRGHISKDCKECLFHGYRL